MRKFRVATRSSLLAFTQTEQAVALLKKANRDCDFEILKFSTQGDRVKNIPLTSFGGTGVFVKELENAISEGKADFAVHSLKDVPSVQPQELILAAYIKREDPRDVLIFNDKEIITSNNKFIIGTGSPRRILQLSALYPEAIFKDLRGNINTRIDKLRDKQYDAIVLASAGLNRLGVEVHSKLYLPVEECIPAVGQATLALECRKDDDEVFTLLRSINDFETETAVTAERSFMKRIGGGCKFPLAAYAFIQGNTITLETLLGNHNTYQIIKYKESDNLKNANELGKKLAERTIIKAKKIDLEY